MGMKNKLLCLVLYIYLIVQALIPTKLKFKGNLFYGDMILFIFIILYIISILVSRDARKRFKRGFKNFFKNYLSLSMFLLLIVMAISTIYAKDKGLAFSETIRFTLYIMVYFIITCEVNSKKVIEKIFKIFIGTCVAVSIFGIVQYFTKIGLDKKFDYYGKGLSVNFRIESTMDNPNSLGALLILVIFPLIVLTLYEKNKKSKILYAILSLIVFSNIALSMSRNAWLGVLLGSLILIITYNWKGIILLILGLGASLTISPVRHRLKDFSGILNDPRRKMWKVALKMIKDNPIFGVGNGNYTTFYGGYVKRYPELKYGIYTEFPSHNSYLKVQSELGILGIVFFISLLASVLIKLKNVINFLEDGFCKAFYKGFYISAIVFLFMNIPDNLFFVPKISMYFWIIVAISQAIIYNNICAEK